MCHDNSQEYGFTEGRVEDLKTAVAEACLNAIEHGNKMDTRTQVGITLTIEESKLQVSVRDEGKGIAEIPAPALKIRVGVRRKTGDGGSFLSKIWLMRSLLNQTPKGAISSE